MHFLFKRSTRLYIHRKIKTATIHFSILNTYYSCDKDKIKSKYIKWKKANCKANLNIWLHRPSKKETCICMWTPINMLIEAKGKFGMAPNHSGSVKDRAEELQAKVR